MDLRMGVALTCVVLLLTSCGEVQRRRSASEIPKPMKTISVGIPLEHEPPTEPPASVSFVIRLSDGNDLHPVGIPVEMQGAVGRTLTSDANGEVRATVPAGIYRFKVLEGCHATLLVTQGGSARVGIVEGKTVRGTLLVLWQHRFGPTSPVFTDSETTDWRVGRNVEVRYTVNDRCSQKTAPGKSFPTFVFKTSPNLKIVSTPVLRADGEGRARVVVSCTKAGDMDLDVVDKANPDDHLDLVQLSIGYGGVPRCA